MPNKITPERKRELFRAALSAFRDYCDPLSTDWLSDHAVTLDEAGWLAEAIADAMEYTQRNGGADA